jgi:hypothetical protein
LRNGLEGIKDLCPSGRRRLKVLHPTLTDKLLDPFRRNGTTWQVGLVANEELRGLLGVARRFIEPILQRVEAGRVRQVKHYEYSLAICVKGRRNGSVLFLAGCVEYGQRHGFALVCCDLFPLLFSS